MKIIFLFLIFCNAIPVHAQSHDDSLVATRIWRAPSLPVINGDVVYTDTILLSKAYTQKRLLKNAGEWIGYNLTKEKKVLKADSATKTLAGKGRINYNQGTMPGNAAREIRFQYLVTAWDGGYNYKIYDINGGEGNNYITYSAMYKEDQENGNKSLKWTARQRYEMLSDLHSYITLLIAGLQEAMLK